jgi:hypothetical protein
MMKDRLLLDRKFSVSLAALLCCSHALPVVSILVMEMAPFYRVSLVFSILVSLVFNLNRFCLLNDRLAVLTLSFNKDTWQLALKSGEHVQVQLEYPVFVNRSLVVMNFHDISKRKFPVAVFSDGADATQMRHLRVFLKLGMAQPKVGGTRMVSLGASSNSG